MGALNAGTRSQSFPVVHAADLTEGQLAVSRGGDVVPLSRSGVLFFAPTPHLGRRLPLQAKNPASERGTTLLRSPPLSSPPPLSPELAQIRLEVHLNRVTLRGDVTLPHPLFGR